MKYRPHIDGLRTVAIVPVVLFHADVALFSGGFTGVDVFFVISGFLITSLIVEEIAEDRFTIWTFYKRRFLRILPAYLVVIAAVVAASWFVLFPEETRALGRSVAAASLFVSNFYFWQFSDYFAPDVATAPLLHTWTLAVEEQYYLLLPLFLLLVARVLGRRYVVPIVAVSLLSFGLSVWGAVRYDSATFYLLPTRAWEFGLGSLAAVAGLADRGSARWRGIGATLGTALVAWGIFGLDEDVVFPGANAIYPALGAMLLIACAEGTPVGRVLGARPFVAIGRISYSLYLWHWPIIVFWKLRIDPALDAWDVAAICALSLLAAGFSYTLVEEPFRGRTMRRRPAFAVNATALGGLALAAGLGGGLVAGAEIWGGHSAEVRRIASYVDYRTDLEVHPCLIHARVPGQDRAFDPDTCLPTDPTRPTLLVMGDSHAEHLMPALEETFADLNLQFAASTGCTPTIDVAGDWYCPRVIGPVLREHVPRGGIDTVLLSTRWEAEDIEPLRDTVDYLLTHVDRVVILGPTPEYLTSFPAILARNLRRDGAHMTRFLDPELRALDRRMANTDWGGASYVSLYDLICPDECRLLTEGGVPYLADYGHYTRASAREIVADLRAQERIAVD
ncbi:acyltransferase family protein [uncultured Jannaschia sp.]|uniref:acyltransferase family protein n=1 Tax=uncultured Jannaschia sp. TaxID=293347 RepID=UPI002617A56A|nr:acyltransferase family protein [uncultured Jannaschia sp.]